MEVDRAAILPLMLAPARAYRELLYRPTDQLAQWIGERFEILARPGRPAADPPRPGDVLLTVTLGSPGAGECSMLIDAKLIRRRPIGGGGPGWYCTVADRYGVRRRRRILDT